IKIPIMLVGLTLSALPAAAQTAVPQAGSPGNSPQTVTLSGCVATVNQSPSAFFLSNAAIVPTSAQPGNPTTAPPPTPVVTAPAQAPAVPPVTVPATPPPAVAPPPTAPPVATGVN